MKRKKIIKIGVIILSGVLILGGAQMLCKILRTPATLNDIAYDVNRWLGYTVYIPENDEYVPYLVLTNDYNGDGNVLLLREHLLDESVQYAEVSPIQAHSYYKNTYVDIFLNETFFQQLDTEVQQIIVNSEIIIRSKIMTNYDIGMTWNEPEQIKRKIFLLSSTEIDDIYRDLWGNMSEHIVLEGTALKYFRDGTYRRKIAYRNNKPAIWWVRTPDTRFTESADVIGADGASGSSGANKRHGVRPAFCLPRDTAIRKSEINGEKVYVLVLE